MEIYQMEKQSEKNHGILNGKTINFIGDSITYGAYKPIDGDSYIRVEKRYCEIACEILGAKCRNYGVSGVCISSTSFQLPESAICRTFKDMNADADIIVVAGGSNDFGTSVIPGNNTDKKDISFKGALCELCSGLAQMYPTRCIVFITPLHRYDEDRNSLGYSLGHYRQMIYDIANGIYKDIVLDGWSMGLTSKESVVGSKYMPDGVHPTPYGHEIIGENLAAALNEAYAKWIGLENG